MSYLETTIAPLFNSRESLSGSLSYIFAALGLIVDIPCAIFLFNEFRYPKSSLRSAYFVMLSIGLVIIVFTIISRMWIPEALFLTEVTWQSVISSFLRWFSQNALGYWNFTLACNRCTALVSLKWHNVVSFLIIKIMCIICYVLN